MDVLPNSDEPISIEVGRDLDLHVFRLGDLPDPLPAWFQECRSRGTLTVRVIRGKGSGALRRGVHALLPRLTNTSDPSATLRRMLREGGV